MKDEIPKFSEEMNYGIELVKDEFNLSNFDFNKIVDLTIWGHDQGKLQDNWQKAHTKEKYKYVAHAERKSRPPNHAAESLLMVIRVFDKYIVDELELDPVVVDVIGKAILTHHTLSTTRTGEYKVSQDALKYVLANSNEYFNNQDIINFMNNNKDDFILESKGDDIADWINVTKSNEFIFYFILVRLLRLSDQKATKKLNEGR